MDENGHKWRGVGGLAEWISTFQDLPKYNCAQNLTHLKHQSQAATIFGRAQEQCKYCETIDVLKFFKLN